MGFVSPHDDLIEALSQLTSHALYEEKVPPYVLVAILIGVILGILRSKSGSEKLELLRTSLKSIKEETPDIFDKAINLI